MTEPEHRELEAQVDEWGKNGITEETHDRTWRLSIVTARKKDGSKWTLDVWPVNEIMIPDSFTLPLIGDMFTW
jgi:hypothetical protein